MRICLVLTLAVIFYCATACGGGGANPGGDPPVITAVSPLTAVSGSGITFSATNAGGAVLTWVWNFGGGSVPNTSAAAAPSVTAGSAGSYSGSVTASNSAGSDTFNFTLTVASAGGGNTLGTGGGSITLDNTTITVPQRVLIGDVQFSHATTAVPGAPPADFAAIGEADVIAVDHPEYLNAPVELAIHYDDTGIDESRLIVLQYTPADGYQAVTLLDVDTAANIVTFDARDLATFVIGTSGHAASTSANSFDTGFVFDENGWQIANFGNYFDPSGNCLGMCAYAMWYFGHRSDHLYGHFSDAGAPNSVCRLLITRAHMAQSQTWAIKQYDYLQQFDGVAIGNYLKVYLQMGGQPLGLIMANPNNSTGHVGVVHGYDSAGFLFYDPDFPNEDQELPWDSTNGFGTYSGYTKFGFIAMPTLGRTEDFEALTQEADGGFTNSGTIQVLEPTPDQHVTGHETTLEGSIIGDVNPSLQLLAFVKGVQQIVPLSGGVFNATIPIAHGDNSVVLVAGTNINQQSDWYRNAATYIFNVIGDTASELLATLTWEQFDADVDLYGTDPLGDTCWYQSMTTTNGLFLDFDNIAGFGPEHVTLATAKGGKVLDGNYKLRVHYYSDHNTQQAVSGVVTVVIYEGFPDQKKVTVPFAIGAWSPDNDAPGSAGADWVDIATVDLKHRTIHVP